MEDPLERSTLQVRLACGSAELPGVRVGVEQMMLPIVGLTRFAGTITLRMPSEGFEETATVSCTTLDTFFDRLESVAANGTWSLNLAGELGTLSLSQLGESVTLQASSLSARLLELRAALESFVTVSALKRLPVPFSVVTPLRGEQHRYYTREPMTKVWFQELLKTVALYTGGKANFSGSWRTASMDTSNSDFAPWVDEVEKHWDDLKTLSFNLMVPQATRWVSVDFLTSTVSINLNRKLELADQPGLRFQDFVTALGLYRVEESVDFSFARTYAKRNRSSWDEEDSRRVSEAIRSSVQAAYGAERISAIYGSFTEGGKAERQVKYGDLEDFLEHLKSSGEYQLATLTASGKRGESLSFWIQPKESRVRVSGVVTAGPSFEGRPKVTFDKQVNGITSPFLQKEMGLELTARDDKKELPGEVQAPKEKSKLGGLGVWAGGLVATLLVALVGGAVGANGLQSLKPTLEITAPVGATSGKVAVAGDQLPIRWTVTTQRYMHPPETKDILATVLVRQRAAPYHLAEFAGQRSGDLVRFGAPGVYDVTVRAIVNGSAWERSFEATVTR